MEGGSSVEKHGTTVGGWTRSIIILSGASCGRVS